MGGRRWTPAEDALLRAHYADTLSADLAAALGRDVKSLLNRANGLGLRKTREHIAKVARDRNRQRKEAGLGNAGAFKPGLVPWNKGMDYRAGGRSVATQFAPGNKPWTWKPVGSMRVVEGQLQCKTNDLPGRHGVRWQPYTRIVWERTHGPVPPGHIVVFRPGRATTDPEQITLDAVELITRAEHAQRNSWTRLPPELREITRLRATLTRFTNQRARDQAARSTSPSATADQTTHPTDTSHP